MNPRKVRIRPAVNLLLISNWIMWSVLFTTATVFLFCPDQTYGKFRAAGYSLRSVGPNDGFVRIDESSVNVGGPQSDSEGRQLWQWFVVVAEVGALIGMGVTLRASLELNRRYRLAERGKRTSARVVRIEATPASEESLTSGIIEYFFLEKVHRVRVPGSLVSQLSAGESLPLYYLPEEKLSRPVALVENWLNVTSI